MISRAFVFCAPSDGARACARSLFLLCFQVFFVCFKLRLWLLQVSLLASSSVFFVFSSIVCFRCLLGPPSSCVCRVKCVLLARDVDSQPPRRPGRRRSAASKAAAGKRKRGASPATSKSSRASAAQATPAASAVPEGKRRVVAAEANRLLSLSLEHGAVTDSARDAMARITTTGRDVKQAVDQLRIDISAIAPGSGSSAAQARAAELLATLDPLLAQIHSMESEIKQLCQTVVLRPEEYSLTQHLLVQVKIFSTLIDLFRRELTFLSKFSNSRPPSK